MKRPFFAVIALAVGVGLTACDTGGEVEEVPPVEETEVDVEPLPAPAPAPEAGMDTMMMDTMAPDTGAAM